MNINQSIAHPSKSEHVDHQSVKNHLLSVGGIAASLGHPISSKVECELIGILHDFGKYSAAFQHYMSLIIKSNDGNFNPDEDGGHLSLKGKIDHSTAGAQWVFSKIKDVVSSSRLTNEEKRYAFGLAQMLSICIASHHSGLIDNLPTNNSKGFVERIRKDDNESHLSECCINADAEIIAKAEKIIDLNFIEEAIKKITEIANLSQDSSEIISAFNQGFYTRMLFSALVEADRTDSADFEFPANKKLRSTSIPDWALAIERFDEYVKRFTVKNKIDEVRNDISNACFNKAFLRPRIATLTVPTGGGKTISSFRYAIHHCNANNLERVIYVIPFTSIIEQNAAVIREIIEREHDEKEWVLEHHSNIEPENQTWQSKLFSDNWDSPVIFTTMVQLLEALFGGGTRGPRRLNKLANSLIIFDEIQTLPVNCIHIFNNAINFLTGFCKTSALLCTATQPLLDKVNNRSFGALNVAEDSEIIDDIPTLFDQLKRVEVIDKTKPGGWSKEEIAEFAIDNIKVKGSCLIIVNTKQWAQRLFKQIKSHNELSDDEIFHLSTAQCPMHRKSILDKIRLLLKENKRVCCISTQLIEAGVDIDFPCVIRFLAGMDSIAQSAGRCNRNGKHDISHVYVINPDQESIDQLHDIKIAKQTTTSILFEHKNDDLLSAKVMQNYFDKYLSKRDQEMLYPLDDGSTLLHLLSTNEHNPYATGSPLFLKQSFMKAGNVFKSIDAPTHSVVVPYEDGKNLITELCSLHPTYDLAKIKKLLKQAQKYTVSLFPNTWKTLIDKNAIYETSQGSGIFILDKRFYSNKFGVSETPSEEFDSFNF